MSRINTDQIASNSGGTTALTIADSGNVGIGTASPSQKVTVDGGLLEVRSGNSLMLRPTDNGWDFRIKTTGVNLDFHSGGNLTTPKVSILNAGGLTFNGDTAAANALDDYEEGTWTAAFSAGGGSITINSSSGAYTKIGRQVTVTGNLTVTSVSSPSGDCGITGLPFAAGSSTGFRSTASLWLNALNSTTGKTIQARIDGGSSTLYIFDLAGGTSGGAAAYFKASSTMHISLTYFTA